MEKMDFNTEQFLSDLVEHIKEKKGEDIVSLKFSPEQSSICDYFLICTANNGIHAKTICDNLVRGIRKNKQIHPASIEGYNNANWILIDYGDIIVHIFEPETRKFYGIEKLWADAEIKNY